MTVSEDTPLLQEHGITHRIEGASNHEIVYQRFSPHRKRVLISIVSWCALLPLFVSASIFPTIPQMVEDFNSTPQVIGLAVSISVLALSIGAMTAASYSTFYGRRPIYLVSLPLLVCGSFGVTVSRTVGQLFFFRVWQAAGASPGFSVGAGVVGDIYKLEERGTAMGIFLAAGLMGPAFAPVAGGIAAEYASWRVVQFVIGIFGLVALGIIFFFFPETSHPGIKWTSYVVNPFSPLGLLRAPNILAVPLACFTLVLTYFVLMVPLAYTVGTKFNIKNVALLGACAIPSGIGEMIGAPLSGYLSDRMVIRWRKARGGVWYPEDRLRAALSGALIIPLSMILSGIVTEYVQGPLGLGLVLACFFINGFGLELVFSPASAYVVDVLHSRSAEAAAAINGFRALILSFTVSAIMPMIETYGVMITNIASAVLACAGFGLLWLIIQKGESLRAWCGIGFSTADNN